MTKNLFKGVTEAEEPEDREVVIGYVIADEGEWLTMVRKDDVENLLPDENGNISLPKTYRLRSDRVGQCIGMSDERNRLIFENDIVRAYEGGFATEFFVFYDDEACRFVLQDSYQINTFPEYGAKEQNLLFLGNRWKQPWLPAETYPDLSDLNWDLLEPYRARSGFAGYPKP